MPGAEYQRGLNYGEYSRMPQLQVAVIDLGENNIGSLGPTDLSAQERTQIVQNLARPEYSLPASRRWICVDGRPSEEELLHAEDQETADPQTGGGKVISDTAAYYMSDIAQPNVLSETVGLITRANIADDIIVTVHGDEGHGKEGCKANADLRTVLQFNAENADIVAPKAWAVVKELGLDDLVSQDDITASIVDGKNAADNDELWDATATQVADIIIANGGEYIVLKGLHHEKTEGIFVTNEAFVKARFILDHSDDQREIHAFAAAMGCYKDAAFESAKKHSRTERDAALQTARVALFNVGLSKTLANGDMRAGIISRA